jgi:hypothetical protein
MESSVPSTSSVFHCYSINFPLADMYSIARLLALAILLRTPPASAHGMIIAASGDAGGNGIGLADLERSAEGDAGQQ